jgi:leucyl-tRNA synthetase
MDTFVCSSWYYLRYPDPNIDEFPFNRDIVSKWLPVDIYIGGAEHAVLHLLYARFITKFLFDEGLINFDEPFSRLVHQGTITRNGAKMSKSRGNVVNPDSFIDEYGADTFRMYLMFTGPYEEGGDWNDKGIRGIYRFLCKAWALAREHGGGETRNPGELERMTHFTVKKVTEDIERFHFNTAVSALMEYVNFLSSEKEQISKEDWADSFRVLILLIGPFAPHFGEELWKMSGGRDSLFCQRWPSYDEEKTVSDEITLVVQINGKVRQKITVPSGLGEKSMKEYALGDKKIAGLIAGKNVKKTVVVPDKLVNIVV